MVDVAGIITSWLCMRLGATKTTEQLCAGVHDVRAPALIHGRSIICPLPALAPWEFLIVSNVAPSTKYTRGGGPQGAGSSVGSSSARVLRASGARGAAPPLNFSPLLSSSIGLHGRHAAAVRAESNDVDRRGGAAGSNGIHGQLIAAVRAVSLDTSDASVIGHFAGTVT